MTEGCPHHWLIDQFPGAEGYPSVCKLCGEEKTFSGQVTYTSYPKKVWDTEVGSFLTSVKELGLGA